MKRLFVAINFLLLTTNAHSHHLVSATEIMNRSTQLVQNALMNTGWNTSGMTLNPVISYKIKYITTDIEGNQTYASGAIYIPQGVCDTMPIVSYLHGTEFYKENVPSRGLLVGQGLLYSGNGYITLMPDYLGLGDNPGIHPYIHAETEATATLDLIRAAREFLTDSLQIRSNGQIFLAGYSQGGHAAMAAHKYVSDYNMKNEFNIVGSAPMSGPYDLSGAQFDLVFDADSSFYRSEFIPYVLASYQLAYGNLYNAYSEYYYSPYDTLIEQYLNSGAYTNTQWNQLLPSHYPDFLSDFVINAMMTNPNHPARQDLEANNLYDWSPQQPIRMLYCGMDSMVDPANTTNTLDSMNAKGATDVSAVMMDPNGTHESCFIPATSYSLLWFDSLRSICGQGQAPIADWFSHIEFPLTYAFHDSSLHSPTSWIWDFNDGDTSHLQNPTHVFPSSGTYNVCLTVSNAQGSDTYCKNLIVGSSSIAWKDLQRGIWVTPNPSNGSFLIQGINTDAVEHVLIMDTKGSVVHRQPITSPELHVQLDLAPGIYTALFSGLDSTEEIRIVINR